MSIVLNPHGESPITECHLKWTWYWELLLQKKTIGCFNNLPDLLTIQKIKHDPSPCVSL